MITFVNMFTVKTGQQAAAFAGIQQIYSEVVKFQPGFISATLLKSDDGNTVTAIAQWETAENLASLSQQQPNDRFILTRSKIRSLLKRYAI